MAFSLPTRRFRWAREWPWVRLGFGFGYGYGYGFGFEHRVISYNAQEEKLSALGTFYIKTSNMTKYNN